MTPEGRNEAYLHKRVEETGGDWRRLKWLGRRGCPDDVIWWPDGKVFFVEVKAPGEKPKKLQLYEHKLMRKTGLTVFVVDGPEAIDAMLEAIRS